MTDEADCAVVFDWGATPADIGIGIAKSGGGTIVLADSDYAREVRHLLTRFAPIVSLDGGVGRAVEALRATGVRGITTCSERMLPVTAELAEALRLPYHSPDTVRALTDKHYQREKLRAAGVDSVRAEVVREVRQWTAAVDRVGLPAVLKPCRGEGSENTYLVTDSSTGRDLTSALLAGGERGPLLLEEYLAGRDEAPFGNFVSVECAAVDGALTPLMVTGKLPQLPPFREVGQFWPAHLSEAETDEVRALAVRALRALGVTIGISHTEIKLTSSGPRIIEVNGRPGGRQYDLAQRAAGIDLVELSVQISMGTADRLEPITVNGVFFQFFPTMPTFPCRFDGYAGVAEALDIRGIDSVRPLVLPGTRLPGGVGTRSLQLVCGTAVDYAGMFDSLDRVRPVLGYDFTTADGQLRLSAEQLWQ